MLCMMPYLSFVSHYILSTKRQEYTILSRSILCMGWGDTISILLHLYAQVAILFCCYNHKTRILSFNCVV